MRWLHLLMVVTMGYCYPKLPCLTSDGTCAPDWECAINKPEDCTSGHFKLNVTECGCCPACIRYLGRCVELIVERGEPCRRRVEIPTVYECGADLVCSGRTGTCVPPSAEFPLVEEALYTLKRSKQSLLRCLEAVKLHAAKPPECTENGAYAPRQCRGEVCFCVTTNGTVIPHYKVVRKHADSMGCVCARVEYQRNSGRMCDQFGNYKPQ